MASLATVAFAAAAFGVAAFLPAQCTVQDCPMGTFNDRSGKGPENGTAGQLNGTACSECDALCRECFGSGATECFECMNVFVASGATLHGRPVVECLFTCPEGFGLSSTTLECMLGAQSTVSGLDQVGIAVLSVCSLVIAALLLLTLFLLREGYTCWEARHRKKVELQGSHAMEMNNVETIVNEFSYVAEPDNPALKSGSTSKASTNYAQHLDGESAPSSHTEENGDHSQETLAAQGYMQMSQVYMEEGQPQPVPAVGCASLRKSAAHKKQEDLAAQGYITMHSTASCSKEDPGAGLAAQGYITMRSTASHSKEDPGAGLAAQGYITMHSTASRSKEDPGAGLAAQGYITMHSTASRSKEDPGAGLAAQGYITMHSTASLSKEDPGAGHSAKGSASKRTSSWLLSDQVRPEPFHSSLPRRGYSVSRSVSSLQGKVAGMRARADSLEGQDYVHVNHRTSIGGLLHHYDQLRERTTSQISSSHYEVIGDEANFPASFGDGYDRVRSRSTTGSDSIYWYASSGRLLPIRRSRQPTADSEYVAMRSQIAGHRPPALPSADMEHLYERTPGFPNRASNSAPHNYYNLEDVDTSTQ